ncbi:MAG: permease [Sediminispirochaetaceae bacterium]
MKVTDVQKIKTAFQKAFRGMFRSVPAILIVVLLISLLKTYVAADSIVRFFGLCSFTDTLLGALFGSILAGNSINSYIIGSELLSAGVPYAAVTSFLAAWVIVGIVQLPAESVQLGTRFAVTRAVAGFFLSVGLGLLLALFFRTGLI